jgi:uncharacterized protein (TIGR02118 family)
MVAKIVTLYGQPDDPESWDRHYVDVHLPLGAKLPGVKAQRAARVISAADGSPSPYYGVGELVFEDMNALQAAAGSPEGQAASQDLAAMAPSGSLFLVAEDII